MTRVVGVIGGSGGVGASTFAAILARAGEPALLIDVDVSGGGIDVLLGVESVPGARWTGLRLAGGRLDPAQLLAGLPRWGPVPVLASDTAAIDPAAVAQVLEVATSTVLRTVVVDLGRMQCAERAAALLYCSLVVLVARADVPGLVAAHAAVAALPDMPLGVVVRRGEVQVEDAASLVGAPLLGTLPPRGGSAVIRPDRLPRGALRVAGGVLAGLHDCVPA